MRNQKPINTTADLRSSSQLTPRSKNFLFFQSIFYLQNMLVCFRLISCSEGNMFIPGSPSRDTCFSPESFSPECFSPEILFFAGKFFCAGNFFRRKTVCRKLFPAKNSLPETTFRRMKNYLKPKKNSNWS